MRIILTGLFITIFCFSCTSKESSDYQTDGDKEQITIDGDMEVEKDWERKDGADGDTENFEMADNDIYEEDVPKHGSVDCSITSKNGVWKDPDTGLIWQKNPESKQLYYQQAEEYCRNLKIDTYANWRLPTIGELRTLIRGCSKTEVNGTCKVTDNCLSLSCGKDESCFGCEKNEGPANGSYSIDKVVNSVYWSSSDVENAHDKQKWSIAFQLAWIKYQNVPDRDLMEVICVSDETSSNNPQNLNTTWYDHTSNLMWQNPPTSPYVWKYAKTYCHNLCLNGYDDWRLPTISELRSLIRGCSKSETGGACGITDNCRMDGRFCNEVDCFGCTENLGLADGCYWPDDLKGQCGMYWSSSEGRINEKLKFIVDFNNASVSAGLMLGEQSRISFRCVR